MDAMRPNESSEGRAVSKHAGLLQAQPNEESIADTSRLRHARDRTLTRSIRICALLFLPVTPTFHMASDAFANSNASYGTNRRCLRELCQSNL